ncbi:MAG: type 1 glutamine amidotransferase [Saprospiraceae bacterium]
MEKNVRIAVLDLYNGEPNQGMRCIKEILTNYQEVAEVAVYDLRGKNELPDTGFDIFICSGGPGHPLEGDGVWDKRFYKLIYSLWLWNQDAKHNLNKKKKHVFFICHSFQMACHLFQIGEVTKRHSKSFGIFPVHKTAEGQLDSLFKNLSDPFYAADFRDYQVVNPNQEKLDELGAEIIALEKIRPHVDFERAIMAVRFSEEFFGVQFHPEADPAGMLDHFSKEENKQKIIEEHGLEKFEQMMNDLKDPQRIQKTHSELLPQFIDNAIGLLEGVFAK